MLSKHYSLVFFTTIMSTACDEVDDSDQMAGTGPAPQTRDDYEDDSLEESLDEFGVAGELSHPDEPHVPEFDIANATRGAQAGCGKTLSPSVSGGAASWSTTCENGSIRMKGWVKDTSISSKCAWVRGEFSDGTVYLSAKACGNGIQKTFDWSRPGYIVDGYLIVSYP